MIDLIEEFARMKDYKLQYRFNHCKICEDEGNDPNVTTYMYVHDFGDGHNINQYHGRLGLPECHMEKPIKICTFCKIEYTHEHDDCQYCRERVELLVKKKLQNE